MRVGDEVELANGERLRIVDLIRNQPDASQKDEKTLAQRDGYLYVVWRSEFQGARVQVHADASTRPADLTLIERLAASGNANGLYHWATLLEYGERVAVNQDRAAEAYEQAANRGHVPAMCMLATLVTNCRFGRLDYSRAARLTLEAARLGDVRAMRQLPAFYEHGRGVSKDETTARFWREHGTWQYTVGIDWEAELQQRLVTLRAAPLSGDPREQLSSAKTLLSEGSARRDPQAGLGLLESAASHGLADAQVELALSYARGLLVRQDIGRCVQLLRTAAAQGHPDGLFHLGDVLLAGGDAEANSLQALAAWGLAAELGHSDAQAALAEAIELGRYGSPDLARVRRLYERAAAQRHPNASYRLACMHEEGRGASLDPARAFILFEIAARQGHADAQFCTARMALANDGSLRHGSVGVGLKYLEMAVNRLQPSAVYLWAKLHEHGLFGVQKSEHKASYWYGIAAGAGMIDGCYRSGLLEVKGLDDQEPDLKGAYKSFEFAARHGHVAAKVELAKLPVPEVFDHERGR